VRDEASSHSRDLGLPKVKRIANICAFAGLLPLIYLAEWVPGLLPRSPNLAYSSDPAVASIGFPITAGILALLGFISWWSLRRQSRFGIFSFAAFWLAILTICVWLTFNYKRDDFKAYLGLALLLYVLVLLVRGLNANWRVALRSNDSSARDI
jgi:hypothetical protein